MGLFNLFKPESRPKKETALGIFTLLYSGSERAIWTTQKEKLLLSVRGTNTEPSPELLEFLSGVNDKLVKLDQVFTEQLTAFFTEAELPVNFTHWNERFQLNVIAVEKITDGVAFWTVTFEDLKEGFAHFNLTMEGEEVKDFSIDS